MADRYALTGSQAAVETSPGETILQAFHAGTSMRGAIYYFSVSAGGTMADQLGHYIFQRHSVVGTEGSGVTPVPLDFAAPASIADGGQDHSAEPTYTSAEEVWEQDVHVRALAQIQLQPDGHIIMPALAGDGLGMQVYSSNYTGIAHCTIHFLE